MIEEQEYIISIDILLLAFASASQEQTYLKILYATWGNQGEDNDSEYFDYLAHHRARAATDPTRGTSVILTRVNLESSILAR